MIHILPELLPADTVQQLRCALQALPAPDWADGKASAGPQARAVKANEQLPHTHPMAAQLRSAVLQGLDGSALFFSAALPQKVSPPRVNRYTPKHPHYGPHIDAAVMPLPNGQRVRADLSCTVFLSEPEAYDGGELVIYAPGASQRIKLPAGHAVLYPSTHLHEVTPVTRGERLAAFFWVQSMVASGEQRRILWDLDMNVLQLRAQHGESAQTTALTGVYHNLLRQWAST